MADDDQPLTKPDDAFFDVEPQERLRCQRRPYELRNVGMAIILARDPELPHQVFVNRQGDMVHINNERARYAKYLVAKMMTDMSRRLAARDDDDDNVRIGERESFDTVIVAKNDRLTDALELHQEDMNQRRRNLTWSVLRGFNTAGTANPELDQILLIFARYQLGALHTEGDELVAAIRAVQQYYRDTTNDGTSPGDGWWSIPIILMLIDYMEDRNVTHISMGQSGVQDRLVRTNEHRHHSRDIWIPAPPPEPAAGGRRRRRSRLPGRNADRIRIRVESCPHVIQELQDFAEDVFDVNNLTIPLDMGPPEVIPVRRIRTCRSLNSYDEDDADVIADAAEQNENPADGQDQDENVQNGDE